MKWPDIAAEARTKATSLGVDYITRLEFEIAEIEKTGNTNYWVNIINRGYKFDENPNSLVLPFLFERVPTDPLQNRKDPILNSIKYADVVKYQQQYGFYPHDLVRDYDNPDIDIDCLPEARDPLKRYAIEKYSSPDSEYGSVCSVATYQTFKLKKAIGDAAVALNQCSRSEIFELTNLLPDEVDQVKNKGYGVCSGKVMKDGVETECGTKHKSVKCPACGSTETESPTIGKILLEQKPLYEFNVKYPSVMKTALNLIGKVRETGMHSGALIISDRDLYGNIPMAISRKEHWVSLWTEGRNTQLSKFGYIKWDVLGLKTLEYINNCCKLIKKNRGISFGDKLEGWDDANPETGIAGYYIDTNGERVEILLNDPKVLELANKQQTDTIFQFDTRLAKSILANGVSNINDLLILNACGHPGPMNSIPDIIKNRDDKSQKWLKDLEETHPALPKILKDSYGHMVFQEDLAQLWQVLGGFSAVEAQDARKAVAKKWTERLKPIEKKWIEGASPVLGEEKAKEFWVRMRDFGRYAFNKCLSGNTILTDRKTGISHTIAEWFHRDDKPHLSSYVDDQTVDDGCVAIHDTGKQEIFEVEFDNGTKECVTIDHKFLCSDGEYHTVRDIVDNELDVITTK